MARNTAGIARLLTAHVLASAEEPARPDPEAAAVFRERLAGYPGMTALGPAFTSLPPADLYDLGGQVILDGLPCRLN